MLKPEHTAERYWRLKVGDLKSFKRDHFQSRVRALTLALRLPQKKRRDIVAALL